MDKPAPAITASIAPHSRLPDGFSIEMDATTMRVDNNRLLVGGSPLTAMRLSGAAQGLLTGRRLTVNDAASAHLAERLVATNLAHPVIDASGELKASDVTVVIPVRDRPDQLDRCLAALHPLAVIVVDDASRDPDTVAGVVRRRGATLVALTTNRGPAGARNAGLARVTTSLVAFVDSDVIATPDALVRLTRHLLDPNVSLVGPRVVGDAPRSRPRWFERYDAAASSLDLGPRPCSVRPGASVAWLPSACLVGRADHLIGGFDPDLRVGEDVDLVWRLVAAGRRVRYEPTVTVRHAVRPTLHGWLGRKALYGSGGAVLAQRHGANVAPAALSPIMAVAGAAILMRRPWAVFLVSAAVGHAATTVARAVPSDTRPGTRLRVATTLAARGVGWSVRQESSLLVRHWWPATAIGCTFPSVRRAVATALLVDTVIAAVEHRDDKVGIIALVAGRRLEDLAYGAGLWLGAVRARSTASLRPRPPRQVTRA